MWWATWLEFHHFGETLDLDEHYSARFFANPLSVPSEAVPVPEKPRHSRPIQDFGHRFARHGLGHEKIGYQRDFHKI